MKKLVFITICISITGLFSCNRTDDISANNALVYGTIDGKIVKINEDGSGKTILVSNVYSYIFSAPVNGKFIYGTYDESTDIGSTYLYDLNNNTSVKIIEDSSGISYTGVSLSHAGDKVLLKVSTGNNDGNIAVINTDGTNLRILTTGQDVHENIPVFSPDDSKIAFYSNYTNLFVVNANGTNLIKLDSTAIYGDEGGLYINWSPNGSKIAYVTENADHTRNLSTINANGTSKSNLLSADHIMDPIWSNDNLKLVFTKNDESGEFSNIFSINSNGTNETNLTNYTSLYKYYSGPEYSSTNDKISFVEIVDDPTGPHPDDVLVSLYILNITSGAKLKISTNDVDYPYKAFWIE